MSNKDQVSPNYINHVALVLDASGSMHNHLSKVPVIADDLIRHLAELSTQLDQETRITIYSFDTAVKCLVYDKDVLRVPSIKELYRLGGSTALIDATLKAESDLEHTAQLYGDHAFLMYVLTDGFENASKQKPAVLKSMLDHLADNWTVATFVPNQQGVFAAKSFGFPNDNIALWDTASSTGLETVGHTITTTTDNYMRARATGLRGTQSLFTLTAGGISAALNHGELKALKPGQFTLLPISFACEIKNFVEGYTGRRYQLGEAYYELTKREEIQAQKEIAIFDPTAYTVYHGAAARQMLGLPDGFSVKVSPVDHPDYKIFVQSTSVNRKLVPGTQVLLLS